MSEPTGHRLGRYRLIRRIAKGGMAEVYLARSQGARGFEKTVAIKRILPRFAGDEQFINMMVDEAKITVLLNHPNIAQIIEFGEAEDSYFIVMEYVPGQSLSALNKRLKKRFNERMGVLEASYIVVEMLQGLHAAHEQKDRDGRPANIIHRDVSPQNCLIGYDGNTKIIDFGIAKAKDRIEKTQVGTIKGKLRYLAPEMIDPGRFGEQGKFDRRVDIFAAGICLFELVAGRQLFQGDNEYDVYKNITDNKLPDLAAEGIIDEPLQRILERALAKHAEDRYRTAEVFADDLRAYVYRTDPSFKSQRIATLMDKCFEAEKEALANLEAEDASQFSEMPQELTIARRGNDSSSNVGQTRASRKRPRQVSMSGNAAALDPAESTEDGRPSPNNPHISALEDVNPSAKTAMVGPEHLAAVRGELGEDNFNFDEQTAALGGTFAPTLTEDVTRLTSSEHFDDAPTPATSTEHLQRTTGGTKWVGVIAAASIVGVILAVGGVLMAEKLVDGGGTSTTDPGDAEPEVEPEVSTGPIDGKVTLVLNARPATARVIVGSNPPETVPATIVAEAGTVAAVRFEADGYKPLAKAIKVPDDVGTKTVEVELEPEPVDVVIDVLPDDALVRVDGTTYFKGMSVMPGERVKVSITADGYKPVEQTVTAQPGEDLLLPIQLEKLAPDPEPDAQPDPEPEVGDGSDDPKVKKQTRRRGRTTKPAKGSRKGKRDPVKTKKDEEEAANKGTGVLFVKSVPYWGRVQVDGDTLDDPTPVRKNLPPGKYKVTVSHPPKGLVKSFSVTITAGKTTTRTVTFD